MSPSLLKQFIDFRERRIMKVGGREERNKGKRKQGRRTSNGGRKDVKKDGD